MSHVNLGQFPAEHAKFGGESLHILYIIFVAVVETARYMKNSISFLFHLTICCRPEYGLLLPFPLPPGGADVIRRGLNIVRTDVCVC